MADCAILLHGLGRTEKSMRPIETALEKNNYFVVNQGYPSRRYSIAELATKAIEPALKACRAAGEDNRIYFVTHSLGGILLRTYLAENDIIELQRAVMLAPPNHGSELADRFGDHLNHKWLIGKPLGELGTDPDQKPKQLGPAGFDVGIIAGTRSYNPFYSAFVDGTDDGKVSVESTRLEGMSDHLALPVSHSFMMKSSRVQAQILHFFSHGNFERLKPDDA